MTPFEAARTQRKSYHFVSSRQEEYRVQRDVFGWGRHAESVVPQVFELQVWYGLGLHYNTHGKYIVMETLYFLADFFIYHEPYTNETRMTGMWMDTQSRPRIDFKTFPMFFRFAKINYNLDFRNPL